jgi:hypothetical protein
MWCLSAPHPALQALVTYGLEVLWIDLLPLPLCKVVDKIILIIINKNW